MPEPFFCSQEAFSDLQRALMVGEESSTLSAFSAVHLAEVSAAKIGPEENVKAQQLTED